MANPSTAHEPSMEEILASIRQIISEDGESAGTGKAAPTQIHQTAGQPEPAAESEAYESVVSRFDAEPEPMPTTESEPVHHESIRQQSFAQTARPAEDYGDTAAYAASASRRQLAPTESPLLSAEQRAAVSGSFGALAQTILAQNSRSLEDVVSETLQPMLKAWLDDNLPSLVERMVREEIERVSRGRR
jgi:uncharacterized protein